MQGKQNPRERIGSPLARRLIVAMAGSASHVGRLATHPKGAAFCLALGYMVLCGAYILFSGRIAARSALSVDQLRDVELLKGLGFVLVTGTAYFGFAAFMLKRIASQQRHLALIFQGVSDCLFLLQVEAGDRYRFLCVNAAFLKTTGFTREQVTGKRTEDVLPETSHARMRSKIEEAIRERKTVSWEGSDVYPAGPRTGEITLTPLADKTGAFVQVAGVARDITERRRAAERIDRFPVAS